MHNMNTSIRPYRTYIFLIFGGFNDVSCFVIEKRIRIDIIFYYYLISCLWIVKERNFKVIQNFFFSIFVLISTLNVIK